MTTFFSTLGGPLHHSTPLIDATAFYARSTRFSLQHTLIYFPGLLLLSTSLPVSPVRAGPLVFFTDGSQAPRTVLGVRQL